MQSICDLAMRFGEKGQARPFGVSLLVAGVDESGPCLFHTDPAGTFTKYLAKAIGAGSEGAQNALQEQYHKSLTLAEAKKIGLEILKQVSSIVICHIYMYITHVCPVCKDSYACVLSHR